MAIKRVKGKCGKCNTVFIYNVKELNLHAVDDVFLCPKCCKDVYWFEKQRCGICNEKEICEGKYLMTMKLNLEDISGI